MSLINEALRKVQNQRTEAPGLGAENGSPSSYYSGRSNRSGLMIALGGCIVILIGLVVGLTVILLNNDISWNAKKPGRTESTSAATDQSSASETGTASTETKDKPSPPEPIKQIPEKPAAEPDQKIVDWLAQSEVTGVRITSKSSKVILNNKAFVPGDSVDSDPALKVLEIEAQRITFVDSKGVEYIKLF